MLKEEMETVVNISYIDDHAEVYSSIPSMRRKLRKWAESGLCEIMFDHEEDVKVRVPIENLYVTIRKPRRMTEEQRAAASEWMRNVRSKRGERNV